MTTECYVTIHDQDLIRQCEERGQFDAFSSHTYLFVGPRPVDQVPDDVKMIVARDWSPNKEHWPQFYDFTGWWVLAHHRLIEADNLICMQYDMTVVNPQLETAVNARLAQHPGMIAFNAGYSGPNWMLQIPGFEAKYREGIALRGVYLDGFPKFHAWPSTQGTGWRADTFVDFMLWFEPMFDAFHDHVFAGHLAERTVKAFHVAHDIEEQYMLGAILHTADDCHGTGALMAGRHDVYAARNAEFMYQSS